MSDVLVRSFVPVRIGQTGCLFDRVSGQMFGNDGTGDFVLGPDVTYDAGVIPTRMMVMGSRKKEVWPVPQYTGVTLVGSSVQNNNGILSGFTSSSYATMPWRMTAGATSLEACIKFHWNGVYTTNSGIWGCVGSIDSFTPFYFESISFQPNPGHFGCYLSSNGSSWTVGPTIGGAWTPTYPAAGDYILRLAWNGTTATLSRWAGSAWTQDATVSISSIYGEPNLVPQLGTNRGTSYPFLGTIDLNYTYLMRDGELLWEGVSGAYKNVKTTYPD